MAFLFKKKKGSTTSDGRGSAQQQGSSNGNEGTPVRKPTKRWASNTPPTKAIPLTRTPDSIMKARQHGGYEDFEVLTPETRSAIQEREDIRKQLFSDSLDEGDLPNSPSMTKVAGDHPSPAQPSRLARTATAQSMEVTADGRVHVAAEEDGAASAGGHVVTTTSDRNAVSPTSTDSNDGDNNNNNSNKKNKSPTISKSSGSPRRHGYPLLGSFRQRRQKQQQRPPKKQGGRDASPSHGSVNSAVYRGPVSVDSPARVLTKAGQPFDESMEKDDDDEEQRRASANSAVKNNNNNNNQSNNSSMVTAVSAPSKEQDDSHKANNTTLSSGILQQQQEYGEELTTTAPVDLDETADNTSMGDTRTTIANDTFTAGSTVGSTAQDTVTHVAEQLLGSFQCGGSARGPAKGPTMKSMRGTLEEFKKARSVQKVMDLFYDRSISRQDEKTKEKQPRKINKKRPFYDETFTIRFIRRMTTKGAALLYLQPPGSPENDSLDWKGRTVTMLLERGMTPSPLSSSSSSSLGSGGPNNNKNNNNNNKLQLLPRLEWTTIAGGQSFDVSTKSIGLFDILSISTSKKNLEDGESKRNDKGENENNANDSEEEEEEEEEDHLCFFTITATNGDLHVFEANSTEERDSLVNGLKNVISRMAFHLVVGDATASSELFDFDGTMQKFKAVESSPLSGDLPSLANPRQTMNRLAHLMLDS